MDNTLLEIKDLTKAYYVKQKWGQSKSFYAVNGVNFTLTQGKCLGLVGESGCGKSTLARMLLGLLPPTEGSISIEGEVLFQAKKKGKQKAYPDKIQMVFQDPFSSLNPRLSIGRSLAEPLLLNNKTLSNTELKNRVYNALQEVGLLQDHYDRYPHEFSGGQRQRIALARALITRPKLIVCDEPVSALDTSVQAHVLSLMQSIKEELNISYLFISHDLHVVAFMSDDIAIMYAGRIVEKASKEAIFNHTRHPYTKALLDAAPNLNEHHRNFVSLQGEAPNPFNPPSGCPFHPRCVHAKELCNKEIPLLKEIQEGGEIHQIACHFPLC